MSQKPNLVNSIAESVRERAAKLAQDIASSVGRPADAEEPSRDEIRQLWHLRNPNADPMQVDQMLAAGQHAQALDLVFPWRSKLIGTGTPSERVKQADRLARIATQQTDESDMEEEADAAIPE